MSPGGATLAWFRAWGQVARFALFAAAATLSPATYTPRARTLTMRQIYFAAWQVLPGFLLFCGLLGLVVVYITISVAREYGLGAYALELVFRAFVLEVLPLVTALFVALRSGAAINTEIALMRVSGELDELYEADVDPFESEFMPRLIAAAVSVVSLTILSCALTLAITYLVRYGLSPWGFDEFTRTIAWVFGPQQLAGFALKCFAFGVAVAAIPIAAGIAATRRQANSAPGAVMGGMVRLFFALGLIEIVSLSVKYV